MSMIPFIPMIPIVNWNEKPPTLYSILESIVNYDSEEKTKIRNLAKQGRIKIFDFDYELSDKVDKEKFECQILNHFIMRRIGFETVTAFKIQLEVKLNEIMPKYNKMFNMINEWDIFKDGEKITRNVEDTRHTNTKIDTNNSTESQSTTIGNNISDIRSSDTPQSQLEDVRAGEYVDKYDYKQDESESSDISSAAGTSNSLSNINDSGSITEITERTQNDKLRLYIEFSEKIQNIYSLIFKDLECLFYQLI